MYDKFNQILSNITKFDQIQPNPTKANQIQPNSMKLNQGNQIKLNGVKCYESQSNPRNQIKYDQ